MKTAVYAASLLFLFLYEIKNAKNKEITIFYNRFILLSMQMHKERKLFLLAKATQGKSRISKITGTDVEISHIDFLDLHCCIRAR